MKWFYMSFVDNDRPKGDKFIGAIVAGGASFEDSLKETWIRKINPGGEIAFVEIPNDIMDKILPDDKFRLLSKSEAENLFQ